MKLVRFHPIFMVLALVLGIGVTLYWVTQAPFSNHFSGKVIRCIDGDEILVEFWPKTFIIRLNGIDAPEGGQPFDREAEAFLTEFIGGKEVELDCISESMGRKNCNVFLHARSGTTLDVSNEIVARGLAWDYPKYSEGAYKETQEAAKDKKIGLWDSENIVSPYCWRWQTTPECEINTQHQP